MRAQEAAPEPGCIGKGGLRGAASSHTQKSAKFPEIWISLIDSHLCSSYPPPSFAKPLSTPASPSPNWSPSLRVTREAASWGLSLQSCPPRKHKSQPQGCAHFFSRRANGKREMPLTRAQFVPVDDKGRVSSLRHFIITSLNFQSNSQGYHLIPLSPKSWPGPEATFRGWRAQVHASRIQVLSSYSSPPGR